jgi:hypothetical protein
MARNVPMRWKVPPGYLAKTESLFLLIARGPKDAETLAYGRLSP